MPDGVSSSLNMIRARGALVLSVFACVVVRLVPITVADASLLSLPALSLMVGNHFAADGCHVSS
jgi:hypothetical protein